MHFCNCCCGYLDVSCSNSQLPFGDVWWPTAVYLTSAFAGAFFLKLFLAINLTTGVWFMSFSLCFISLVNVSLFYIPLPFCVDFYLLPSLSTCAHAQNPNATVKCGEDHLITFFLCLIAPSLVQSLSVAPEFWLMSGMKFPLRMITNTAISHYEKTKMEIPHIYIQDARAGILSMTLIGCFKNTCFKCLKQWGEKYVPI